MVHSVHPVLNWRRREGSEHGIEFGEGVDVVIRILGSGGTLDRRTPWEVEHVGMGETGDESQRLPQAKCLGAVPSCSGV